MDPKGKIALVTGAAKGIGVAIATELLHQGCKGVSVCDVDIVKGQETVGKLNQEYGKGKAIFIKTDVTKEEDIEDAFKKTVEQFGGIDIVVNNAGMFNEKKWRLLLSVNLIGVIVGTQVALKYMSKDQGGKGGVVVNLGSTAGVGGGLKVTPFYTATKSGVVGLTRCFRSEFLWENTGVRMMVICPGSTSSNMLDEISEDPSQVLGYEQWKPEFDRHLPILGPAQSAKRVGEGILHMIREGKPGSVWMSERDELYEIHIPEYQELRV